MQRRRRVCAGGRWDGVGWDGQALQRTVMPPTVSPRCVGFLGHAGRTEAPVAVAVACTRPAGAGGFGGRWDGIGWDGQALQRTVMPPTVSPRCVGFLGHAGRTEAPVAVAVACTRPAGGQDRVSVGSRLERGACHRLRTFRETDMKLWATPRT